MTTTTRRRVRNPYKVPQGFSSDPFTPLYQQPDEPLALEESLEELLDYANILEDKIAGDFNLHQIVTDIKSNFLSFVRTGLLAYKVKLWKLYRNSYRNFKEFCENALGVTHWQINRTIEAARVVMELVQSGFSILPQCEAQARPLTKFTGAELCANWQIVVENLPPSKITGNSIAEVLGMETKAKNLRLPKELYERIRKRALELGISVEQLLELTFGEDDEVNEVDEEKMAAWEEDLARLTQEMLTHSELDDEDDTEESVTIGTNFSCSTTGEVGTTPSVQKEEEKSVTIGTGFSSSVTETTPSVQKEEEKSVTIGTPSEKNTGTSKQNETSSCSVKQSKAPKTFLDLMNPKKSSKVKTNNKSKKPFQRENKNTKKRGQRGFDYQGKDDS